MQNLAKLLIVEERRTATDSTQHHQAAFRVCEKLRAPLMTFAGAAGYRSLITRALTLARTEAPLLAGLQIQPDGAFQFSPELQNRLNSEDSARAGAVLVDQLLTLVVLFIGEALTLRLVDDVWPKAANRDSQSKGEIHEN